jgi:hypothetical protein
MSVRIGLEVLGVVPHVAKAVINHKEDKHTRHLQSQPVRRGEARRARSMGPANWILPVERLA